MYASATGATACTGCAAGFLTDGAGQSSCSLKVCDAGYYSVGLTCVACVPGKYSHFASTVCTMCPAGTAQHKAAESSCPSCAQGTVQPLQGQERCVKKSMMMLASELVAQSSGAEVAVGALAALAAVGIALAGIVEAIRRSSTVPSATVDEMEPLFSKA